MKNPYLVVIDVQEKLFPIMHEKETFLKNLQILIKGFQLFNLPILLTEQVPDKLGPTIEPIMSLLPDLNHHSHAQEMWVSRGKLVVIPVVMVLCWPG